ncbi:hypothetical protein ACEXQD_16215 [Herbiconiux sp. P15]|uniref:hypothetical protein n=1 Tax=Herbiconiux liukaitaii TaxID=3342799 RepID=UPI0035BABF1D
MTDETLARELTAAIRAVDGVGAVFRTSPLVDAAAQAIASTLDLPDPDLLLDIESESGIDGDGRTTVTVHLSTTAGRPTPETLRAVAALIRSRLIDDGRGRAAIAVKVLQIERMAD